MLYLGGPPPPLPPSAPSAVGASTVGASTAGAIAAGASTAAGTEAPATTSPAPAPPEPDDSAYFKGVIQDVQISNGVNVSIVEFFPLQVPGLQLPPPFGEVQLEPGVLRGVVSDDLCAARPCLHNATCTNTWNDYTYVPRPAALYCSLVSAADVCTASVCHRCQCPRGYKGKQCSEVEFCQLQGCPLNSHCRNLDVG